MPELTPPILRQLTSPSLPQLSYGHAAFKASHNSYDRDERPVTNQLWWDGNQPHQCACRAIELDIQQSIDFPALWSVNHSGGYSGEIDKQFSLFLELLGKTSADRPGHDVITVTVDLKKVTSDRTAFRDDLDSYVAAHFDPDKLFTPSALQEKFAADRAARVSMAWPLLSEMKDRFVFCLSGKRVWKEWYANHGGNLCFVDKTASHYDDVRPKTDGATFYNLNWEIWSRGISEDRAFVKKKWVGALEKLASDPKVVTRAYGLNDVKWWVEAREAGVNILATDMVRRHDWARVGDQPFGSIWNP